MTPEQKAALNREVAELLGWSKIKDCGCSEGLLTGLDPVEKRQCHLPLFTDDWKAAGTLLELMEEPMLFWESPTLWGCEAFQDVFDSVSYDPDPKVAITLAFRAYKLTLLEIES